MSVGWIAFQFHRGSISDKFTPDSTRTANADDGWYNSDTGNSPPNQRITYTIAGSNDDSTTDDGTINVGTTPWGVVKELHFGVDREYGGVNSSGGPQHSGRADHRLITVKRESDKLSPLLFQHCCNGFQLRRVFFVDTEEQRLLIAESCHVVSFAGNIFRGGATKYDISTSGEAMTGQTSAASGSLGSQKREEVLSILYTSIAIDYNNSGFRGWNTGNETAWNAPGYT